MKIPMNDRRGASAPSALRVAATALLVSVAYYIGANIGFILRFPPSTPSVLWPPNAILTATLLLAPVSRWWIYLLAAFPAHLVAEMGVPLPAPLVLALFATNCSEALMAAVCVRRFSDAPERFDTLRRVVVFVLGAVFVAPFASSFADAAAVTGLMSEPYWRVWRTRLFSNVLTELTLVPAILTVVTARSSWWQDRRLRRRIETALLALSFLAVGIGILTRPAYGPATIPGSPYTLLALLLPFILWATVRFGPEGASLSLLSTVLLAVLVSTHGRHPLMTLVTPETVAALQICLGVVAIPLMCLAAVIEERRRSNEALAERLRFEELLSRLSGDFVRVPSNEIETVFESSLRQLGEALDLGQLTLYRFPTNVAQFEVAYSWSGPGIDRVPRGALGDEFPWVIRQILGANQVSFSRPEELPPEAGRDLDTFRRRGIRSNLVIPLGAGGRVLGSLSFVTYVMERAWPDELVQRLHLVGELFANALAQREAQEALRASEAMKSAILASLSSNVAVLDRDGLIITVNDGWVRLARDNGGSADAEAGVGSRYFDICRGATGMSAAHADEAVAGIRGVLEGSSAGFGLEYPCRASRTETWFALSVVPLGRPEGGAVVSHTEVTEQKLAELELQRSRHELTHFARISTMGELTASLAHELNQPLTGILTNAQAAQRLLQASPPELGEVGQILADIVEDDRRAGDVIQRLRYLLKKDEAQFHPVDLNVLIRDVAKLLNSDAVIRNVTVTLELASGPVLVNADAVQLQQVVLNLLLNAMEAMADCAESSRSIVVRSESSDVDAVHVSVQDAGVGLRQETHDLVFEPFYTTEPDGMGMGLVIAKSIVEAHGGVIWATDNANGGATFHFSLPGASSDEARA